MRLEILEIYATSFHNWIGNYTLKYYFSVQVSTEMQLVINYYLHWISKFRNLILMVEREWCFSLCYAKCTDSSLFQGSHWIGSLKVLNCNYDYNFAFTKCFFKKIRHRCSQPDKTFLWTEWSWTAYQIKQRKDAKRAACSKIIG